MYLMVVNLTMIISRINLHYLLCIIITSKYKFRGNMYTVHSISKSYTRLFNSEIEIVFH